MRVAPAPVHGPARRPNTLPSQLPSTPPEAGTRIGELSVGERRGGVKAASVSGWRAKSRAFSVSVDATRGLIRGAVDVLISRFRRKFDTPPRECLKDWTLTAAGGRRRVGNAAILLYRDRRARSATSVCRRAPADDRSREASLMLINHRCSPAATVRDRGAAARPDSNKSNDIGAAGRLVAEPGVGDRRDRDGRQSLARRSPSRRAIQGSRHAGDPSSLPRTNESDRAHIERSRRPNPYASVERSCILSLAARYRPDAREEPDPATTRDSRRILSRSFSRMHRW